MSLINYFPRVTYKVAWSNQCIEYWFLLHFSYYASDNDRPYCENNLDTNFRAKGLPVYSKTEVNIFEILTKQGNPKLAIKYAKRRICECCSKNAAASTPPTKVHELVEELAKYFPEDIKKLYI